MIEKTFYKILIEFMHSIETTKRRISDKRLTVMEKLIIEGHLNIRRNLNEEVLTSLSGTSTSELPFVESQRNLLLASAMNNLCKYGEAEKYVLESIRILQKIEAPYFLFYSYHLLFTIYDNLQNKSGMQKTIQEMEGLTKNKRQEAQFLICKFCYVQSIRQMDKATELLSVIDARMNDLVESDIVRQLVNKFMFLVQLERLQEARGVLSEIKQFRNYQLSENYNFMKRLLDHLLDSSPLYVYAHEFEKVPVLLHQLMVIQGLEAKLPEQAKSHWEMLVDISPETYGEAFDYKGITCLFSLALKKHCETGVASDLPLNPAGGNKLEQLYSLLNEAKAPVHGSMIYEILWGKVPVDKEDFKKVSRLISRLKSAKKVSIEFRKGAYFLAKSSISKAS